MSEHAADRARSYYRALDDHDYDALAELLAAAFVHDRPDLTLEGREQFVRFMREERPQKDTTHRVDSIYRDDGGDGDADAAGGLAVRGRLLDADGDRITGFVDAFAFDGDRVIRIDTYTR